MATVDYAVSGESGTVTLVKPVPGLCVMGACRASVALSADKPTKVVLKAKPVSKEYRFAGWSGSCAGKGKKCKLKIVGDISATAYFEAKP
jgi:hypothetical protein